MLVCDQVCLYRLMENCYDLGRTLTREAGMGHVPPTIVSSYDISHFLRKAAYAASRTTFRTALHPHVGSHFACLSIIHPAMVPADSYYELWQRQRPEVHAAMLGMLLVLSDKRQAQLAAVQSLCTVLLSHTLKQPRSVLTGDALLKQGCCLTA